MKDYIVPHNFPVHLQCGSTLEPAVLSPPSMKIIMSNASKTFIFTDYYLLKIMFWLCINNNFLNNFILKIFKPR